MQELNKSNKDKASTPPESLEECEQYYNHLWTGEEKNICILKDSISVAYFIMCSLSRLQSVELHSCKCWIKRSNLGTIPEFACRG
jgi:hypothetical protein